MLNLALGALTFELEVEEGEFEKQKDDPDCSAAVKELILLSSPLFK